MENGFSNGWTPIMHQILEVRYTDLDHERMLCEQLLEEAGRKQDQYAKVFALTYLGDYYLAMREEEKAGKNLIEAEKLLIPAPEWELLACRLHSFLGIYYELIMDEQNAMEYYLKTIGEAERLNDLFSACIALNNLSFIFFRYRYFNEALDFSLKAVEKQKILGDSPFQVTLLVNVAEVYLSLCNSREALFYIEESEKAEKRNGEPPVLSSKVWCSYYIREGNREKAVYYANRLLTYQDQICEDRLAAFEHFYSICIGMIDLGEGAIAKKYLNAMYKITIFGSEERSERLEEARIRYTLLFEPERKHPQAYKRFYKKNKEFRAKITSTVAEAMKSKLYLNQLMEQTELMQSEQQTLEREAYIDELTQIYNRRYMENQMRRHSEDRNGGALGVIVLDVDYFKEYNDSYGHLMGDNVLYEVASCLKEADRYQEIDVCRYGGDEFVCLCKGMEAEQVASYIQSVRRLLEEKAICHETSLCSDIVTLSIGYVVEEHQGQAEGHLLFQLADQALYESKRSGRNTYTRNRKSAL